MICGPISRISSLLTHSLLRQRSQIFFSIKITEKSPLKVIFIAEVGISESHDDLQRSMVLWLKENSNVKLAFLVKISEKPKYEHPKQLSEEMIAMRNQPVKVIQNKLYDIVEDRNGQLFAHGSKFVGAFSGFLEDWVRDSETGKAARKGERIVSVNLSSHHMNTYIEWKNLTCCRSFPTRRSSTSQSREV